MEGIQRNRKVWSIWRKKRNQEKLALRKPRLSDSLEKDYLKYAQRTNRNHGQRTKRNQGNNFPAKTDDQ